MNLFIDTNVYLNFYHFSNDDLEELRKILVAIKNKDIKLYLTDQVIFEFKRNRENKIADALKKFAEQKLPNQFPQLLKNYPEYLEMRKAQRIFEEEKSKIMESLMTDIDKKTLTADEIISELFKNSELIETTGEILKKAKIRSDIGNPPGKNNSYGDALNWEMLLSGIPDLENLYLVSGDGDYESDLNENKIKEFLKEEWEAKNGEIYFYHSLADFFDDKFPNIKLASELEKELIITDLVNSPNFTATHRTIAKLSPRIQDFSEAQVAAIVSAFLENNQITWICTDQDVRGFVKDLIKDKKSFITKENLTRLEEKYKDPEEENEETPEF